MTSRDITKLVNYWKTASDLDIKSAKSIGLVAKQYVQALFFLHFSAEKILKAMIVHQTQDHAPYGHNLVFLAQNTKLDIDKKFIELLSEVNEFNLECRYPDSQFKIYKKANAKLLKRLIGQVEEFREWILFKLNGS